MAVIYTIGHSTRTVANVASQLRGASVTRLADVRAFPRSRTNPQFNIETLPHSLVPFDIDYHHLTALGGRRGARKGASSRNSYWRIRAFRNYADHAESGIFRAALDELERLARERTTAIMCAEALWWRCHRRLVADYLLMRGWQVIHLMGSGKQAHASLTPGATPHPDGTIAYPENPEQTKAC